MGSLSFPSPAEAGEDQRHTPTLAAFDFSFAPPLVGPVIAVWPFDPVPDHGALVVAIYTAVASAPVPA
jgi:hypothetical protein